MIEISQEEFEQYVIQIIQGEKTRGQVVNELETSFSTFNNRIAALADKNPNLYKTFIQKYPYSPKERREIDIIKIGVQFLSDKLTMPELAKITGVPRRTIRRRLDKLKSSDDPDERELYDLCRAVSENHRHSKENSIELQMKIEQLIERFKQRGMLEAEDNIQTSIEIKRQELKKIKSQYDELRKTMTSRQAATEMGTAREVIQKQLNRLAYIEKELQARETLQTQEDDDVSIQHQQGKGFLERIQVSVDPQEINLAGTSNIERKELDEPEKE